MTKVFYYVSIAIGLPSLKILSIEVLHYLSINYCTTYLRNCYNLPLPHHKKCYFHINGIVGTRFQVMSSVICLHLL